MSVPPPQEEVRQLVRAKRRNMVQAFRLLQEPCGDEPVVKRETWKRLVRAVQPGVSAVHRELLWNVSDEHNRGYIGQSGLFLLLAVELVSLARCLSGLSVPEVAVLLRALPKASCCMCRTNMLVVAPMWRGTLCSMGHGKESAVL